MMGAGMWGASDDAVVKLGDAWVRRSAVEAVNSPHDLHDSRVTLACGEVVTVRGMTPEEVILKLWKGQVA